MYWCGEVRFPVPRGSVCTLSPGANLSYDTLKSKEPTMSYSAFVSAFRSAGSVSVRAWLGDRSFVYSFSDLFEFDEWCQWEGGDFDRLELAA